MKRKTTIKLISCVLCIVLLCGLLDGCNNNIVSMRQSDDASVSITELLPKGNNNVSTEQGDYAGEDEPPEDIVVHTDYGDLHYPDRWQEYVIICQEQNGSTITVTFETKSGEETYELFKILIGDDSSNVVGSLTDAAGTQRNVYLHVDELPADSGLEETEQTRFYAMQEDLNYLIDNLK